MFNDLVKPSNRIADYRSVFDPTDLSIFKRYETGYVLFFVLEIPEMLKKLRDTTQKGKVTGIEYAKTYKTLINTYVATLEREFKGLEGLENITSESIEYSGLNEVTVSAINSVNETHNPTITLTYTEPYGEPITKTHELYLKGLDDPIVGHRKHYNGLIDDGILTPDFENETFKFLYMVIDNTGLQLERAYYIFNAQPTGAQLGELYNGAKYDFNFKEIQCEFRCNALSNDSVQKMAKRILEGITGYRYDSSTKKVIQIAKPAFETQSPKFEGYRVANDAGNTTLGGLSFTGKQIYKTNAEIRQLGKHPPKDWLYGKKGNTDTDSSSTNKDTQISKKDNKKEIKIDKPVVEAGSHIWLKYGATLSKSIGNNGKPETITYNRRTGDTDSGTGCKLTAVWNEVSAKVYAQESKETVIYGTGSNVYPYTIQLDGKKWYVKAGDFFVRESNNRWIDPVTKVPINLKTGEVDIFPAKFKIGDMVAFTTDQVTFYDSYIRNSNKGRGAPGALYKIIDMMPKDKARQYATSHNTNYVYSNPNVHAYKVEIQGAFVGGSVEVFYANESELEVLG